MINLCKKVLNWLFPNYKSQEGSIKTLKELDFTDTVWILYNNILLEGWVFDINKKHIIVTTLQENGSYLDFRFNITRPLSQTRLIQNNKILFLNKPCAAEILFFVQQKKDISNT